jgi:hypothetical protein
MDFSFVIPGMEYERINGLTDENENDYDYELRLRAPHVLDLPNDFQPIQMRGARNRTS